MNPLPNFRNFEEGPSPPHPYPFSVSTSLDLGLLVPCFLFRSKTLVAAPCGSQLQMRRRTLSVVKSLAGPDSLSAALWGRGAPASFCSAQRLAQSGRGAPPRGPCRDPAEVDALTVQHARGTPGHGGSHWHSQRFALRPVPSIVSRVNAILCV